MTDVMQPDLDRRAGRQRTAAVLILLLITATVFSPVCFAGFLGWDDQNTLFQNADMNPPTVDAVVRYWKAPAGELYIPITYTVWLAAAYVSYSPNADANGIHLNAAVFH